MKRTQRPAQPAEPVEDGVPYRQPATAMAPSPGVGPEVWLSFILGVIFMIMGRSFALWVLSGGTLETGVNWTTGPNAGQPVTYFELAGGTAWTDTGIFLFGFALLLEATALLAVGLGKGPRVPLVFLAITITFVAAFLNLGVAIFLLSLGITPLFSLLAFGFGVYLLIMQWQLLRPIPGYREG